MRHSSSPPPWGQGQPPYGGRTTKPRPVGVDSLQLHAKKVSKGGLLVVTVPNFAGLLQRGLHVLLDAENLKRHNIQAMCPEKWKDQLLSAGFSVHFHGSIGSFDFWTENPNANRFQIIGSALVKKMIPFLRCFPPSKIYSPFYGVIARKIS